MIAVMSCMLFLALVVYGGLVYYTTTGSGASYSLTDDALVISDTRGDVIYSVCYRNISAIRKVNRNPITNWLIYLEAHRSSPWDYSTRMFGEGILVVSKMNNSLDPGIAGWGTRRVLLTPDNTEVFLYELEGRIGTCCTPE